MAQLGGFQTRVYEVFLLIQLRVLPFAKNKIFWSHCPENIVQCPPNLGVPNHGSVGQKIASSNKEFNLET